MKQWYQSKRFWAGILGLLTSISLVATGEKSLQDPQFLSEIVLGGISLVQTIIGLVSGEVVAFGSKTLYKKK